MQVLEGQQTAVNQLLSRANDALQTALVLGGGSSVPDGDGGGEDGLNDGSVEVHHHCLWQVELLPQEVHPLLCFTPKGISSHLRSWEPRKRMDSTVLTGESPRAMWAGRAEFFQKFTTISTVFRAFSSKLL